MSNNFDFLKTYANIAKNKMSKVSHEPIYIKKGWTVAWNIKGETSTMYNTTNYNKTWHGTK